MPIASVTTANMGTPSTKAANIRCTSAVIHTNARAPMTGNSPYARLVSAAAWSNTKALSVIRYPLSVIRYEERSPLREVDRHRAAHFGEQLGCHLASALAARPRLHPLHHDAPHERGAARDPLPRP